MDGIQKEFGYKKSVRTYLSAIAGIGFLGLVETSVVALVIFSLIKDPTMKLLVGFTFIAVMLGIPTFILTWPLRTRHGLSETFFHLRYGNLKLDIPRVQILSAQPFNKKVNGFDTFGARYESANRRLNACFSTNGQVLLVLEKPMDTKRFKDIREVLINVDDSTALLKEFQAKQQGEPKTGTGDAGKPGKETEPLISPDVLTGRPAGEAANEYLIKTTGLSRRFGDLEVVRSLNLNIHAGEIYGFLGCNGAGKTTTIKMLVGLLEPCGGTVEISGVNMWKDPENAKQSFGYVPDRALLYDRLTGREYLEFIAQLREIPALTANERIEHWLRVLDLSGNAGRLCGKYSFGMKQKLSLAAALLHQPRLLILDEPLNGLDPRSARRLKDLFKDFAENGIAIFMSTHDLSTAESVCTRVGILHGGNMIAEGSADHLREITPLQSTKSDLEEVFLQLTREGADIVGNAGE